MTTNFQQEVNKKCAELLKSEFTPAAYDLLMIHFNVFTDANDRDLVIEKARIDIDYSIEFEEWVSTVGAQLKFYQIRNIDRTTAILKCICSVLDIEWREDGER